MTASTIPAPGDWPSDATLVSTLAETFAEALEDAEADSDRPLSPRELADAVIEALDLDAHGWVLVRELGDRPDHPFTRSDR